MAQIFGVNIPFGMSNANNPRNPATPPANPNFPANKQLDPKNMGADPANVNNQNVGNNEPGNDPNAGKEPGSQLDSFADVFKLPTSADGQPQLPTDPMAGPITNIDPAKLREAASKMNFAAGVSPELLQKAMSGQDPQAFMAVLNTVAQNGFTAALTTSTNAFESGIAKFRDNLDSALPERVRQVQIRQAAPRNPVLNHPAAKPVVEAMKLQIATANPSLPPDRVAEMSENYFLAMMQDMNTNTQQQQANLPSNKKETDWMALLDPNSQS